MKYIIIICLMTVNTARAEITQQDIINQACDCYFEGIDNCGYTQEFIKLCKMEGE